MIVKVKFIKIHRLLAELFIENPLNLPYVDHYDKNRSNNCLSNLRWISPRDNNCNHKLYPSKYYWIQWSYIIKKWNLSSINY